MKHNHTKLEPKNQQLRPGMGVASGGPRFQNLSYMTKKMAFFTCSGCLGSLCKGPYALVPLEVLKAWAMSRSTFSLFWATVFVSHMHGHKRMAVHAVLRHSPPGAATTLSGAGGGGGWPFSALAVQGQWRPCGPIRSEGAGGFNYPFGGRKMRQSSVENDPFCLLHQSSPSFAVWNCCVLPCVPLW